MKKHLSLILVLLPVLFLALPALAQERKKDPLSADYTLSDILLSNWTAWCANRTGCSY